MSYKDGIPLLTTFDEEEDPDDYMLRSVRPSRRCKKRHILMGIICGVALLLVVGLAVSVSLGVTLHSSGGDRPSEGGHGTSGSTSDAGGVSSSIVMSLTTPSQLPVSMSLLSGLPSEGMTPSMPVEVPATSATPLSILITPSATAQVLPTSSSVPSSAQFSAYSVPTPPSTSSAPTIATPTSIAVLSSMAYSPVATPSLIMTAITTQTPPTMSPSPTPGPSSSSSCSGDGDICQSSLDERTYDFGVLDNGLRVVVISDPSTDLEGASVNVAAGSFNDPSNLTGLAHFCEHMLFLGSGKYPGKDAYSDYLSTHGGYDNAFTAAQETDYHFRINAGYLRLSLDMLAHFFIDPLFTPNSTFSEMYAVSQEHEKNLHSDPHKLWQLLKEVSNPKHPFSQFATGNFDTLNKSGVVDELWKYFNQNYIAKTMNLAVYGRENTSTLWDWVRESFSEVSDRNGSAAMYSISAFPPEYSGKLIHYEPEASTHLLTIFWPTPSLQGTPRSPVGDFLTRYLGHEGEGSILYYLRQEGLGYSLSSDIDLYDSFSMFSVQIRLTDTGRERVAEVIQVVFHYAYLLANLTEVEFDAMWGDYLNVSNINFDYAENSYPNDYTVSITRVMRVVEDPADFLKSPQRFLPNYPLTISTAQQFAPNNSLVFITAHPPSGSGSGSGFNMGSGSGSRSNAGSESNMMGDESDPDSNVGSGEGVVIPTPPLNQTEPIYGTDYNKVDISMELLQYWSYPSVQFLMDLRFPGPNMFLPTSLELLPLSSNQTTPQQLTSDPTDSDTWFLQDSEDFPQPKANFRCEIRPSNAPVTAVWAAQSRIFASLVEALLQPLLYAAREVGYDYDVTANERGVVVSVSGLSDTNILHNVIFITIQELTRLIREGGVDEDVYGLVLDDLGDMLMNFNFTSLPFRYTRSYIQKVIMERPYWTNEQILSTVVNAPDLRELRNFVTSSLLYDVSITCLTHGNVDQDTADSFLSIVTAAFHDKMASSPTQPGDFPRVRVRLPGGADYGVSLQALNPEDVNSVVQVLYQIGPVCDITSGRCSDESLSSSVYLALLDQVTSNECFAVLRGTLKLGYVAYCHSRTYQGVGSFQVLVQSKNFLPDEVLKSMETFLQDFYNNTILSDDFADGFKDSVAVLKQTLTKKELNLKDKTDRLWGQILSGQNQFNFVDQQVALLDAMTVEKFREFYSKHILEKDSRRKLVIVMYGKDKDFVPPVESLIDYGNLDQTNTSLPLYSPSP